MRRFLERFEESGLGLASAAGGAHLGTSERHGTKDLESRPFRALLRMGLPGRRCGGILSPALASRRMRTTSLPVRWLAVPCALATTACTGIIGAGVTGAFVGAAVLAGQCYGHVQLTARDAETGEPICDADISATGGDDGDDEASFTPCYHAALGPGAWKISAHKDGYVDATGTVNVRENEDECQSVVYTVELTLRPIRSGLPTAPPPAYAPVPAAVAPTPASPPVVPQAPSPAESESAAGQTGPAPEALQSPDAGSQRSVPTDAGAD